MFDARAKALCQAAARGSQNPKGPAQYPTPGYPSQAYPNQAYPNQGYSNQGNPPQAYNGGYNQGPQGSYGSQNQAPLSPPQSPAPGFQRYEVAKGGLYVDLPANYPQGYGPMWSLNGATPQQISTDRYNVLNRGPQGNATFFVKFRNENGRAVLELSQRGQPGCMADIAGLPQVINETPKSFQLVNFRYTNNQSPQCQRTLSSFDPWQGRIILSANSNGDIRLSLVLDEATKTGAPWFEFTAQDLPFPNQMTVQMAQADIQKKAQIAAAQAARAAEEKRIMQARLAARAKLTGVARRVDLLIEQDAHAWLANHYDIGSVSEVKTIGGKTIARYTYNNGMPGAVKIERIGAANMCVQFQNESTCRALGRPESHGIAAGVLMNAFSDSSGSSAPSTDRFNQSQWNKSVGLNADGTMPH